MKTNFITGAGNSPPIEAIFPETPFIDNTLSYVTASQPVPVFEALTAADLDSPESFAEGIGLNAGSFLSGIPFGGGLARFAASAAPQFDPVSAYADLAALTLPQFLIQPPAGEGAIDFLDPNFNFSAVADQILNQNGDVLQNALNIVSELGFEGVLNQLSGINAAIRNLGAQSSMLSALAML